MTISRLPTVKEKMQEKETSDLDWHLPQFVLSTRVVG
jgi:hypothetical protein